MYVCHVRKNETFKNDWKTLYCEYCESLMPTWSIFHGIKTTGISSVIGWVGSQIFVDFSTNVC